MLGFSRLFSLRTNLDVDRVLELDSQRKEAKVAIAKTLNKIKEGKYS